MNKDGIRMLLFVILSAGVSFSEAIHVLFLQNPLMLLHSSHLMFL